MVGSHDVTTFRNLIDALFQQQRGEWAEQDDRLERGSSPSPALATRKALSNWHWKEINETKLQSVLSTIPDHPLDFALERLIMFLPPFPKEERNFVPAMSLYYDAKSECLTIRTVMIARNEDGRTYGLGFRLESPTSNCEVNGKDRVHDFYHVQLINQLGYGPELGLPDWLPCRQPSFSIRANNPVDAILNLILSLYGLDYFKGFLNNHRTKIGPISPLLRELSEERKR